MVTGFEDVLFYKVNTDRPYLYDKSRVSVADWNDTSIPDPDNKIPVLASIQRKFARELFLLDSALSGVPLSKKIKESIAKYRKGDKRTLRLGNTKIELGLLQSLDTGKE